MSTIRLYLLLFGLLLAGGAAIYYRAWLPDVLIGGGVVLVLWVLYQFYWRVRRDITVSRMQEEEQRQLSLQNEQIAAETRRIEAQTAVGMLEVQARVAAMTSFIYPTSNGHYPAIMTQPGQYLLPPGAASCAVGEQKQIAQPTALPHAPHFNEMCHMISGAQLILCYDAYGPVYGEIADLLSTAITGKPGRGKTTALMYYVAILLQAGAEIVVFDPHGAMSLLSEFNGQLLKHMPETARIVYLSEAEDMYAHLDTLTRELAKRNERYKRTHGKLQFLKHPLLLLADELPALASYDVERKCKDDGLMKMIRRFVLEARKWNCYFIGSSQTFDAQVLPTQIRDSLSSRMVFYSSDMRARMAGLEKTAIETLLPVLRGKGKAGMMIFDCQRFDDPILAAIPMIEQQDLADFVGCTVEGTLEYYHDEEMEELQVRDCSNDSRSALAEQDQDDHQEGRERVLVPNLSAKITNIEQARTSQKNGVSAVVERSDLQADDSPAYRFNQDEIKEFVAAYRVSGNIETVLKSMRKGSRYKDHAREIIQAYNLKKA